MRSECPPSSATQREAWKPGPRNTRLCPLASAGIWPPGLRLPGGRWIPTRKGRSQTPESGRKDMSARLPPNQSASSRGQSQGATLAPTQPLPPDRPYPQGGTRSRLMLPGFSLCLGEMGALRKGQVGSAQSWPSGVSRSGHEGGTSRGPLRSFVPQEHDLRAPRNHPGTLLGPAPGASAQSHRQALQLS